ncbi:MAG: DNA polymerase III subunit delta' [Gammaproteobacteria bacterium]|nr:DNA polymerase III subunit delta' [Gammaproteobacteria bacterium]
MIYPWQATQWQHIAQLLRAERLPHALLLHGNQGLGKADFAIALANAVLCRAPLANYQACGQCKSCLLLNAKTHPDLHYLEPTSAKNSKSKNPVLNIRVDDIRDLCETLNQTSQFSGYRVAVLNVAEQLTISAANSLLKTLEEPGQNVLIILVASRIHRLPVTIRSRCQRVRFYVPEQHQSMQWLQERQPALTEDQLRQVLKYANGSPLAAISLLDETEHQEIIAQAMTACLTGKTSLEYAPQLVKFGKLRTLEWMMSWVSDLSKVQSCGSNAEITNVHYRDKLQLLASQAEKHRIYKFYDQLNFNLQHNSIAVNEQLLWENLLLSWDDLGKR